MWAWKWVELAVEAWSGSLVEVVCDVLVVLLNEVVVETGAGVWFEAGYVALAEIVTEFGSDVGAVVLLGVVIEVGYGV